MRHNALLLLGIFLVSFSVFSWERSRFVRLDATGPAQARYLSGDEPAYLLLTHSLVNDFDFNLYNNRVHRDGIVFGFETADGHAARRDLDRKEIYSIHTPGLAILLAPAYAIGLYGPLAPRVAVCLFLNFVAALLAVNIYLLCAELSRLAGSRSRWPSLLATAATILTPPLLFYSNLIYPELPAALLILYALRHSLFAVSPSLPGPHTRSLPRLFAILGAAFLPWLSFRFFLPAFALIVLMILYPPPEERRVRLRHWWPFIPLLGSLALFFLYQYRAFGTINPAAGYVYQNFGKRWFFSRGVLDGFFGIILDRGHGILTWSPIYILSLTGLFLLVREQRFIGVWLTVIVASIYLSGANFVFWWGGFAPPPRYMVAPAPLLAGAMCYALSRRPGRLFLTFFALLLFLSLLFGYIGAAYPTFLYRHRHIINNYPSLYPLIKFVPSFIRKSRFTWPLAAGWSSAIVFITLYLSLRWNTESPGGGKKGVMAEDAASSHI
ncbi:MAG: hypothetical protein NTZ78_05440 [Candidatus Aureabacteria bacterium]|nr:hypothetical protein [Candidatus Auribacterota bacterium]